MTIKKFKKKNIIHGLYGKLITTTKNENGLNGKISETEYIRLKKDGGVACELSLHQCQDYEQILFRPKIIDIDDTEWYCLLNLIKTREIIKCSTILGSCCDTDFTEITLKDYETIINALFKMTKVDEPFRIRADLLKLLYGINNEQIQTFVETFGYYFGDFQIIPTEQDLTRKKQNKNSCYFINM